ncbi:MAG: hypothetical protein KDC38_13315 [Planctomycetes bacterium]|nr:hypothetical protein [Planctomycetota bacterium]
MIGDLAVDPESTIAWTELGHGPVLAPSGLVEKSNDVPGNRPLRWSGSALRRLVVAGVRTRAPRAWVLAFHLGIPPLGVCGALHAVVFVALHITQRFFVPGTTLLTLAGVWWSVTTASLAFALGIAWLRHFRSDHPTPWPFVPIPLVACVALAMVRDVFPARTTKRSARRHRAPTHSPPPQAERPPQNARAVRIQCPSCAATLRIPPVRERTQLHCPGCSSRLVVRPHG